MHKHMVAEMGKSE